MRIFLLVEGSVLNDYVRGALEALLWIRVLIRERKNAGVLKEVEQAIEDINEGVAVDFRGRLRTR